MDKTLALLLLTTAISLPLQAASPDVGKLPTPEQIAQLKTIGNELASAVLHKDSRTVLRYDRPDLINVDKLLFEKKSDLYCYIFDSTCIGWHAKSVYEQLSSMKQLGIETRTWGKWPDGRHSYLLIFYDKARHKSTEVVSDNFLCSHGKAFVTWTFLYTNGSWQSAHPPFDAEVDALCSSE